MHILDNIVAHKKAEIEKNKKTVPLNMLERADLFERNCNSFIAQLSQKNTSGIIAEFKRKSPSRSNINLNADLLHVVKGYESAGASAVSILTDESFFGGHNDFLKVVRKELPNMPILRKEFIIDPYQVIESKAIGADIILLICEILSKEEILNLTKLALSLNLEVLLELHSEDQLHKCNEFVSVIGVNNRDLKTFKVDFNRSKKLFDKLPVDIPKIAESGLSDPDTCVMLYQHGFKGFLIGEQFMKQEAPGVACREFIFDFMVKRNVL